MDRIKIRLLQGALIVLVLTFGRMHWYTACRKYYGPADSSPGRHPHGTSAIPRY